MMGLLRALKNFRKLGRGGGGAGALGKIAAARIENSTSLMDRPTKNNPNRTVGEALNAMSIGQTKHVQGEIEKSEAEGRRIAAKRLRRRRALEQGKLPEQMERER
ncbi:MAG: hypothetical protein P8011_00085 [Acidihalobacter sp.]|uniref:hypothetical protein n=1 Tax=Acidihalobacter sp. TaxID=1872108 RepID=UPI00307D169D